MKTLFTLLILPGLLAAEPIRFLSANLQLHWDFHRELYTSTVEILEGDRYGSMFFFADHDYGDVGQQASYFEISRNHSVWRMRGATLNLSLQYNDGVLPTDAAMGKGIPRTVLYGLALSDLKFRSALFEVQALVRQEFAEDPGWQLTAVWGWQIPQTPFEFNGVVDWNSNETADQPVSVQAEPQLLVRVQNFALGSELEISRNFTGAYTKKHGFSYRTWYTHPTVFLRVLF